MHDSNKVPSTYHLRVQANGATEFQDDFIDELGIEAFDES